MRTRQLGFTDLHFSALGLGSFALGGPDWKASWGPQNDDDSVAAIVRGINLGVNWIDTAPVYGYGHAEEVVGRALKQCHPKPYVATKCGRLWEQNGTIYGRLRKASIYQEAEASLRRLGVEVIDLYQMHWPQPDEEIEEGWGAMADLVMAGKVRFLGASNFSVPQLQRVQKIHPVASLQPPYSLLRRDIEADLLPFCARERIGVVAYSPLQKGLLTGAFSVARRDSLPPDDHRRNDPMFAEPQFGATLRFVQGLTQLAKGQRMSVAELALAWVLRRPELTSAIVGARRPAQIAETVGAAEKILSSDTIQAVEILLRQRSQAFSPPH